MFILQRYKQLLTSFYENLIIVIIGMFHEFRFVGAGPDHKQDAQHGAKSTTGHLDASGIEIGNEREIAADSTLFLACTPGR